MLTIAPFKWTPFSLKQWQLLTWWTPQSPAAKCNGIVAEGSKRSGKSAAESFSFVCWAMDGFDNQNFIMAGKTIGSLRRNVLAPLKRMLTGRGMVFQDRRADNLFEVTYGNHTNFFYLFGGYDESSQDLVQGITAAGAYFDEVALQPESFVNQAVASCSVENAKLWFNCNPESPFHWFKLNWIDKAKELGLFVIHFLMDDNPSLSQETKSRYLQIFKAGTVWFKRYILGLWCIAEGAVYDFFSGDPEDGFVVKELPEKIDKWRVAIDYGTVNPCVFGLYGRANGVWYKVKEYYWDSVAKGRQKTNQQYSDDLKGFLNWKGQAIRPSSIEVDPSATGFILQLHKDFPGIPIYKAINAVLDGIQTLAQALTGGLLKIFIDCKKTIEELLNYVWDAKAQLRGEDEPVKTNDHTCFVAGTIIETDKGPIPIEDVKVGMMVLSGDGQYHKVTNQSMTVPDAEVYKTTFSDGRQIVATGNHPIWVECKGWTRVDEMRYGYIVRTHNSIACHQASQYDTKVKSTEDTRIPSGGMTGSISKPTDSKALHNIFIELFMKTTTDPFRMGSTCITKTAIPSITSLKISPSFRGMITNLPTAENDYLPQKTPLRMKRTWRRSEQRPVSGMVRRKVLSGILKEGLLIGRCERRLRKHVISAAKSLIACHTAKEIDFALMRANPLGEGQAA